MPVNVRVQSEWSSDRLTTVVGVVEGCLSYNSSDGQLEYVSSKVDSIATYLGELTELLVQKGVLSLDEINAILPNFYGRKMVIT